MRYGTHGSEEMLLWRDELPLTTLLPQASRHRDEGGLTMSPLVLSTMANNNSPGFINQGLLSFFNSSTAFNAVIDNTGTVVFHDASTADHAAIQNRLNLTFRDTSTAGNSSIHNNSFSILFFGQSSTAGNATIINDGALTFAAASTAGNANITNNSGGFVSMTFFDTATGGNATITNASTLQFFNTSTAGNATIGACRRGWAAARAMPSRPASTARRNPVRPILRRHSPSLITGCPPTGLPWATT
jgi:hypothetical protein